MATKRTFKVVDGPIRIRRTANGTSTNRMLYTGNQIEVDIDSRTEAGGYVWWQHQMGWSAERSTSGSPVFMEAVGDVEAPTSGNGSTTDSSTPTASSSNETETKFLVSDGPVRVRQSANGALTAKMLASNTQVTVVAGSRTEAGGYVWWQHSTGWSAERSVDGNQVFMTAITTTANTDLGTSDAATNQNTTDSASSNTDAATNQNSGSTDSGNNATAETDIVEWQVYSSNGLNVRDTPGTGTFAKKTLPFGTMLKVDRNTAFEKDGYFWVKHDQGWSAWKNADGSNVFIGEPRDTNAGLSSGGTISVGDLTPAALPGYQTLIEQLPVALNDTQWFQYYGNNTFAYINGRAYNYDGYSQGLHGGLDFGNSYPSGVKIRAGLNGSVIRVDRARRQNWKVWIKSGDYTIIYQHITNISALTAGQPVTPNTVLAEIEPGMNHLHFEIRYNGKYIVNPLWLMPDAVANSLINKFNQNRGYKGELGAANSQLYYFYKDASWSQWITPLDQPIITLAGSVIGPRG